MSISSQRAGTDFCPVARLLHRPNWRPVFAAVLLALTLMVLPLQAQAAVDPQRWTLTDSSGHSWGLTLFEQPDPAYPAGWRLRLTAHSSAQVVDHERPLLLRDGTGAAWLLPNRSKELVRKGEKVIPQSSAQFDANALDPRPSDVLPLQLEVPTDNQIGTSLVMLQPEMVQALHKLPSSYGTVSTPLRRP
jgi:hypothetical protein